MGYLIFISDFRNVFIVSIFKSKKFIEIWINIRNSNAPARQQRQLAFC